MRLVVADTSPIYYLLSIGQIDLLPRLFGKVFVPDAVHKELCHPAAPLVVRDWVAGLPAWAEVTRVDSIDDVVLQPLGAGEYLQSNNQINQFRQFSQCINCMLCYAACPVYGMENEFLGPAAIALGRRYNLDSRDEGSEERVRVLAASEGIWECSFVGECSAACPKGVDPAKAIQQTKFDSVNGFVMGAMLMPFGSRK